MTLGGLSDILKNIMETGDVVGFTIAEFMPFDAERLHNMFSELPLFNEAPVISVRTS